MGPDTSLIGRLAMRSEGEWWNAYYALLGTMDGAILLGSIRLTAVKANEPIKIAFIDIMRALVSDIIEAETGVRPTWGSLERGPEHERAGHA